jgi:hypothetical protein
MSYSIGLQCQDETKTDEALSTILESGICNSIPWSKQRFLIHWSTSNDGLPYIDVNNVVGFNSSKYIYGNDMSLMYSFFYMFALKMDIYTIINDKKYIVIQYDDMQIIIGKENPNIENIEFMYIDCDFIAINYKKSFLSFIKHYQLKSKIKLIQKTLDYNN